MAGKTSKSFIPFINGKAFPRLLADFEPPERKRKTDNYRAGDMLADRKVNTGEEPRSAKFTWVDLPDEVLNQYGICAGDDVRVRVVSSEEGLTDCDNDQLEYVMVGQWDSIKREKLEGGKVIKYTCELDVEEYTENRNNIEREYWHKSLSIHRVGGVDRLEQRRRNLEMPY